MSYLIYYACLVSLRISSVETGFDTALRDAVQRTAILSRCPRVPRSAVVPFANRWNDLIEPTAPRASRVGAPIPIVGTMQRWNCDPTTTLAAMLSGSAIWQHKRLKGVQKVQLKRGMRGLSTDERPGSAPARERATRARPCLAAASRRHPSLSFPSGPHPPETASLRFSWRFAAARSRRCMLRYNSTMAPTTSFGKNNAGFQAGDIHGAVHVEFRLPPDEKLPKIRRWLSAPDPSANYQKALKLRQADTGGWFLEGREYTRWKTEPALPLWLYGIPGCGKTILCSAVLRDVLEYCRDGSGRVAAYFFFDFKDVQKQDLGKMLRSLIW
ncbi:hypothetical protein BU23DRAFT_566060 [Bimuria novae-zelandiae CBS 107.79]|uniref:Nephrocystin 3-like N-terminal domain-containing protein n=1 Tax=Bimuria novae-zelandiae CBS 107.79 TaxID=1447943 RepID=A0A6A5VIC1_9PLEO|nr:hypothetical protein BU23DRAFT_566060 [Bimuria novae-zelandiae CBS 107.79]